MYCVRNVTEDLYWVGANDHRLALFENIHPIPRGVSYNAYLLLDEKSVLFDTVTGRPAASSWRMWSTSWTGEGWITWSSIIWSPTTGPPSRRSCFAIRR